MTALALLNALATNEQLEQSPSQRDGIKKETEQILLSFGCELIQSAGIALKLRQQVTSSAQVLFQRFFRIASLKHFGIQEIGMAALFLASKTEESLVRISSLTLVYNYLIQRARRREIVPLDGFSQQSYDMKNDLVVAEMQILKHLAFDVSVQLPYGLMVNYLRILGLEDHPDVPNKAWGYLNDGLRTIIYAAYHPPTIACAAIWLACRDLQIKLPTKPGAQWWELFEADIMDIRDIAGHIQSQYYLKYDPSAVPLTADELADQLHRR
ncbi:unnamed protein product [Umbelopsis ramanniana]